MAVSTLVSEVGYSLGSNHDTAQIHMPKPSSLNFLPPN